MGTDPLDFLTRNVDDFITYDRVDANHGKISGLSGVNPFIPVTWSATPLLYVYTLNGDVATTTNAVVVNQSALGVPGLKKFIYSGGAGLDFLQLASADLTLSATVGNDILFNGGGGTTDTLAVEGDTNYTLNNFKLTAASGGFVRPVNTERVEIRGGAGNNTINAAGFTRNFIAEGLGDNDTIIGGSGRNILFGGAGVDTITGGGADDILIGGTTTLDMFSGNGADLADEWFGGNAYETRVANIKAGTGLTPTAITTVNTPDDIAIDTLTGNAGNDWFWAFVPNDVLLDKLAAEFLR